MNNNLWEYSIKSVWRNKINILNMLLLIVSSTVIIFGFSYLMSINNLWNDWTNKALDFRIFSVSFDHDEMNTDEAISKLSQYDHVLEVTKSSGYIISATVNDYIDNINNGQIYLKGVTKDSVNVVKGSDLSGKKNEIICPIKFNPNSLIYSSDFSDDHSIDLSNSIGSTISMNFAGSNISEDMLIVGLYDSDYDYSAGEACYATFDTVKYLNEKYQPDSFDEEKLAEDGMYLPIYMIIDNADNSSKLISDLEKDGFYATSIITINTEVGNSILKIVTILAWTISIISFVVLILTNFNRINTRKKEFAIMSATGYTKKDIDSFLYMESIVMSSISIILSIIISVICLLILKKCFLVKNVEFSRMALCIDFSSAVLAGIIIFIIPLLSSYMSTQKIDKINMIDLLKE